MSAKRKPIEGPRPMAVADAHALADRLDRAFRINPDVKISAALIRALLRGRKASDIIEMD